MSTGEPRFKEIFFHRPFLLLWIALLASSAGAFLFVIVLAARVFAETGSSLKASSVFAAQWLLPLALQSVNGAICTRYRIRSVLVVAELLSAVIVIACALALEVGFVPMLAVVMVRGFLEAMTKAARIVALKQYVLPRYLRKASSLFGTSMYLSSGVGAVIGGVVAEQLTFLGVAVVAAMFSLVASLIYLGLARAAVAPPKQAAGGGALATFRQHPALFRTSLQLFVICGVFQGFHNVARTALPMKHLGLGITGATHLQLVSAIAIVLGALFVFRFMSDSKRTFLHHPSTLIGVTAIAMPLPYLVHSPIVAFTLYFAFIFAFEVAYTRVQNEVVVTTPTAAMGHVAAFNQGVNNAVMAVVILAASAAIDSVAVVVVSAGWAAISVGASLVIDRLPLRGTDDTRRNGR